MADPTAASRLAATARPRRAASPMAVAAAVVFALAMVVYLRTLLPGVSVGDWAEMQWIPAQLGIPHPTGYPLYVLLGKAFSLIPVGSLGFRAELLSAVAAAGSAATTVLIAGRLGVRPVIAAAAGLALAVTGELGLEATFSEMNGLHLLLVALLLHRALVWRAERRDRDLRVGALLAGLALANHVLAATVAPIVILFVLVDARARLRERPILLVQAAGLFLLGLSPYLFIPLRGLFGPEALYARFRTWDGFSGLVSGADLRGQMHFGSVASLSKAVGDVVPVVAQLGARSDMAFIALGLAGGLIQLLRDRWLAFMLGLIVAVNIYFFANYVGDLDHYLLVTWLAFAIWVAIALEAIAAWVERQVPARRGVPSPAILAIVLPLVIAAGNFSTYDASGNHDGDRFAASIFDALPPDAVLLTYWDALTNLGYEHCIEGVRPDVGLRSLDVAARVVCDPVSDSLEDVARQRPLYAFFVATGELEPLKASFDFVAGPRLAAPYGKRGLDYAATLYRLVPRT
jgi:hypothetical protein